MTRARSRARGEGPRTPAGRARVPHAGRVGAARRHLDRVAARAARLAGQARPRSTGSTARWSATWPSASACASWCRPPPSRSAPATCSGASASIASACSCSPAPTDRSWTRDYCPIYVMQRRRRGRHHQLALQRLGEVREPQARRRGQRSHRPQATGVRQWQPTARVGKRIARVVLEGGAIDVNGAGTLLATEECLLDDKVQARNPGLGREALESVLARAPGRAQGAVARARHRRRRHARPRRRSGALRRRDDGRRRAGERPRRRRTTSRCARTAPASSA